MHNFIDVIKIRLENKKCEELVRMFQNEKYTRKFQSKHSNPYI